jgi:hypothetical protein
MTAKVFSMADFKARKELHERNKATEEAIKRIIARVPRWPGDPQ